MSFPRYPKYKDSGVEWLGEVPEHWGSTALKRLVDPSRPITYGIVQAGPDIVGGVPYIRPADMTDEEGVASPDGLLRTSMEIATAYTRSTIRPGDLVCSIGPSFGKVMVTPDWLAGANLTQGTARVAVRKGQHPRYVFWALRSGASVAQWESSVGGATFRALNLGPLAETILSAPPLGEQQAIAAFLDRETAKIDALIAEQQRLIELLQEKRQAVISHAVTKGLNPDAPMKDSGIEWLGEVPEHWAVIPLKRLADIQTGVAKGKDNSGKTTVSVPYLRVANVQDGYLDLSEVTTIDIPADELDRYALRAGDVLMNEGGDFDKLGRGCIWEGQLSPCISQNHVFAVRPRRISSQWLNAITGSGYAQFYFMSRSKQSTNLASISSTNLMELPVILPPNEEQAGILAFMARQTTLFASLTTEATQAISLLQERRSALISAAVTGQIDVRGLAGSEAA
jgi:type I restriction enzyme S subunit